MLTRKKTNRVIPAAAPPSCPVCMSSNTRGWTTLACGHAMCSACFVTYVESGQDACHLCRAKLSRTLPRTLAVRGRGLDAATLERHVDDISLQHVRGQSDFIRDFVALAGLAAAGHPNTTHTARLARALREEYRLVMLRLLVRLGPSR